jgi:hypothetical protein
VARIAKALQVFLHSAKGDAQAADETVSSRRLCNGMGPPVQLSSALTVTPSDGRD